jgi:hypothetical protein
MRPPLTAAVICAGFLSFLPSARAEDVPEPDSHTVLEPPAAEAPPAEVQPPAAPPRTEARPRLPRSELGFQMRAGAVESDRFHLGTSFVGSSGPLTFGISGDMTLDVRGSGHHRHHGWDDDDHGDHWNDWCAERSGGRCLNRSDFALSGFGGLRTKLQPFSSGPQMRLELVGELGWQVSYVDERIESTTGTVWSDASRAYPFGGVRGGVGVMFLRHAYVGLGGFARQGLSGKVCVDTDGGCTRVGGLTGGVFLMGGGEWGVGR